jgi:ParB-like chromosome segregation protein Spo0J
MKTKNVKVSSLKPHPDNPNTHPDSQILELKKSLEQFKQVKNIVVWKNKIIAGNGLLEAAKTQGMETIEIKDVSDWSEKKAVKFMVADNRLAELGVMDNDLLSDLLAGVDEPLDIPGVDEDFLDEIDFGNESEGGKTNPDSVPEDVEPVVKSGELWLLGDHRLLCGDSGKRGKSIIKYHKVS